jgi:hypothetical protein
MRRSFKLVPILAVLLMSPMGAQAATITADDFIVCDTPPQGVTVLEESSSKTVEIASPALPGDTIIHEFQVNLYPAKAVNKATVGVNLSWDIPVNDYDMTLIETGQVSQEFQALGDPPVETVGDTFLHCGTFSIEILNFLAVGGPEMDGLDPLQLVVTVGNVT